jgi:hypothetical protein
MLKTDESTRAVETKAIQALRDLLSEIPSIRLDAIELAAASPNSEVDIIARLASGDRSMTLICEVKSNGQPRNVRSALFQLQRHIAHSSGDAVPVFIAPYLSPQAQAICKESNVAFMDFVGNARLVFDHVFIERRVADKPPADRRELRSLFKPKSAQVLRVLLSDPRRAWRVTELAESAGVSLGHVSNVRSGLLDREWARVSDNGLFLSDPDALLDTWRDEYEIPVGSRSAFYTILHGTAFEELARKALAVPAGRGKAIFSGFSAAHWLAPYGRTGVQYFYADATGLERLKQLLKLTLSPKGENVVVTVPKDLGVFRDTVQPAPGAICTSEVQTYLDLWASGERGKEAAEHLRRERLTWRK